jgi:ribosomal protein S3AE
MAERKKFIDVEVPILNKSIQVLGTIKDLENKTIKLDLSRKMRGKGVVITLQIFNKDEKLVALPKKTELMNSYLRRIIRKRTDNVEDSFLAHCSDIRATIKPFLITRKKVSRAVRRSLRNTARDFLISYVKERSYNDLCEEILEGSLQKSMLPKLKKVYPLAFCEIRVFTTKDLAKVDLDSIVKEEEVEEDIQAKKEDTLTAESKAEKEVEKEVIEEVVEEEIKESDTPTAESKAEKEVEKEVVEEVVEEKIKESDTPTAESKAEKEVEKEAIEEVVEEEVGTEKTAKKKVTKKKDEEAEKNAIKE